MVHSQHRHNDIASTKSLGHMKPPSLEQDKIKILTFPENDEGNPYNWSTVREHLVSILLIPDT